VAFHGPHDGDRLVPRACRAPTDRSLLRLHPTSLDSRGVFMIQVPEPWTSPNGTFFIWRGSQVTDERVMEVARKFVREVRSSDRRGPRR
jgi:hypothetical protein